MRVAAQHLLDGITGNNPIILRVVPAFTPPPTSFGVDPGQIRYDDAESGDLPGWYQLTAAQRAVTIQASRTGFDTAVRQRLIELCRAATA